MDLNSYFKTLRQHQPISSRFVEALVSIMIQENYYKGQQLLLNDHSHNPFLYLAKGTARILTTSEKTNEEFTLELLTQETFIAVPRNKSLSNQVYSLQFLQDSTIQSFPTEYLTYLIPNHEETLPLLFSLNQQDQIKKLNIIHFLAHQSAPERYALLIQQNSGLFNTIKQKTIASFLGMDSKTLSRIRAKERKTLK